MGQGWGRPCSPLLLPNERHGYSQAASPSEAVWLGIHTRDLETSGVLRRQIKEEKINSLPEESPPIGHVCVCGGSESTPCVCGGGVHRVCVCRCQGDGGEAGGSKCDSRFSRLEAGRCSQTFPARLEEAPVASPCPDAQTRLCSAVWVLWVRSPWELRPQPSSQ